MYHFATYNITIVVLPVKPRYRPESKLIHTMWLASWCYDTNVARFHQNLWSMPKLGLLRDQPIEVWALRPRSER